jgi:hypothetical protein
MEKKDKLEMKKLIEFNNKYNISMLNNEIRKQIKNVGNKNMSNLRQNELFHIKWVTNQVYY